jgi:hypothetical protein
MFWMTNYIFTITEKFRNKFFDDFYFTNPESDEELAVVANRLKLINSNPDSPKLRLRGPFTGVKGLSIETVINTYSQNQNSDTNIDYAVEQNIYLELAKLVVIVKTTKDERIDKKFEFTEHMDLFFRRFRNQLIKFSLVEFLVCDTRLSMLLDFGKSINSSDFFAYNLLIITRTVGKILGKESKNLEKYDYLFLNFDEYYELFYKEYDLIKGTHNDDIDFISGCIRELFNRDTTSELLNLNIMRLFEYILIHKPNGNIDDSIRRQFSKKIPYILYTINNQSEIGKNEKIMQIAYDIRSDIAHGDYISLNKNVKKLSICLGKVSNIDEVNKTNTFSLNDVNELLIVILRIIVRDYFENKDKYKYVKDL